MGELGNDVLVGGPGNELLDGGPGNDSIDGGGGWNTVSYSGAPRGVRLNLALGRATVRGDGRDRLAAINAVIGSPFADLLVGDQFANELSGDAGNDTIRGGRGADVINGGPGNDLLCTASRLQDFENQRDYHPSRACRPGFVNLVELCWIVGTAEFGES